MNTIIQKTAVLGAFVGIIAFAAPVFAQSYNYSYDSSYQYPQASGTYYYGSPIVYQSGNITPTMLSYMPISMPSYQQQYQPSYAPQYQYPTQQLNGYPYHQTHQTMPQYQPMYYGGYGGIAPSSAFKEQSQYYPYTTTYRNPNSYPRYVYSEPSYDASYAYFSNYYTQYPSRIGQYTGNTDLFGTPLCNWGGGYNGYACDSDPSQPVYDPYTGTWY